MLLYANAAEAPSEVSLSELSLSEVSLSEVSLSKVSLSKVSCEPCCRSLAVGLDREPCFRRLDVGLGCGTTYSSAIDFYCIRDVYISLALYIHNLVPHRVLARMSSCATSELSLYGVRCAIWSPSQFSLSARRVAVRQTRALLVSTTERTGGQAGTSLDRHILPALRLGPDQRCSQCDARDHQQKDDPPRCKDDGPGNRWRVRQR